MDNIVSTLFLPMLASFGVGIFAANRLVDLSLKGEQDAASRITTLLWFLALAASVLVIAAWFVSAVVITITGGTAGDPPS